MNSPEILTEDQRQLLPLVRAFSDEYYLVGGTAIALWLGRRRSVDFDLFNYNPIKRQRLKRIIESHNYAGAGAGAQRKRIMAKNLCVSVSPRENYRAQEA